MHSWNFTMGLCSFLEDFTKKLPPSKVKNTAQLSSNSCILWNIEKFPFKSSKKPVRSNAICKQFIFFFSIFSRWDGQGGYDRSRGNRRNWYYIYTWVFIWVLNYANSLIFCWIIYAEDIMFRILVWEAGFCNFAASTSEINPSECPAGSSVYEYQHSQGLQPELFFKMSHEIYNYGEG